MVDRSGGCLELSDLFDAADGLVETDPLFTSESGERDGDEEDTTNDE